MIFFGYQVIPSLRHTPVLEVFMPINRIGTGGHYPCGTTYRFNNIYQTYSSIKFTRYIKSICGGISAYLLSSMPISILLIFIMLRYWLYKDITSKVEMFCLERI